MSESHEQLGQKKSKWDTFISAVMMIIIADVSMSLDNVLAVAWAANENIIALWIWLIVSIVLMAIASNYIAEKMDKYPQIQWVWLFIILYVSGKMITDGSDEIATKVLHTGSDFTSSIMPIFIFLAWFRYQYNKCNE